jgi:hypothetical protein
MHAARGGVEALDPDYSPAVPRSRGGALVEVDVESLLDCWTLPVLE